MLTQEIVNKALKKAFDLVLDEVNASYGFCMVNVHHKETIFFNTNSTLDAKFDGVPRGSVSMASDLCMYEITKDTSIIQTDAFTINRGTCASVEIKGIACALVGFEKSIGDQIIILAIGLALGYLEKKK